MRKLLNIAALVALLFAAVPAKAQSSDKQGLADYLLEYHINALASGLPADVDVIRTLTDIWFDEDQVVFEFDLDADDVYERFRSGDVLASELLCFGSETRWLPLLLFDAGWGARVLFRNPLQPELEFTFSPEDIHEMLLPEEISDSYRAALYEAHLEAYEFETISVGEDYLCCYDIAAAETAADVEAYFVEALGMDGYLFYKEYMEHLAAYIGKQGVSLMLMHPDGGWVEGPTFTMWPDTADANGFVSPTFRGNTPDTFAEWVAKRMRYPRVAEANGVQGKVYVSFIVGKDGRLTDIHVTQGASPELDAEALRIVGKSPRWRPAKKDGQPVRVTYTIPVVFSLN
ncbi:MAG: energy transducer TonB [Bacteroidota bacterium]|nr:energy transducer TonB [Bacteroidota bacterium]